MNANNLQLLRAIFTLKLYNTLQKVMFLLKFILFLNSFYFIYQKNFLFLSNLKQNSFLDFLLLNIQYFNDIFVFLGKKFQFYGPTEYQNMIIKYIYITFIHYLINNVIKSSIQGNILFNTIFNHYFICIGFESLIIFFI